MTGNSWFSTRQINDWLYLTTEPNYTQANRCNIWLIKGPEKDIIIDSGLGVQNLREHFENLGLLGENECIVIITHVHFDHSGGASVFDKVLIHESELQALQRGRQTETLNYMGAIDFSAQPCSEFDASKYRVPPTKCEPLYDEQVIDIGANQNLRIIHVPGHSKGSVMVYYQEKEALFVGDVAYDCGHGKNLLDILPSSNVKDYRETAQKIKTFLKETNISGVYPGHFGILDAERLAELLEEYYSSRDSGFFRCGLSCLQCILFQYFLCGCFRCGYVGM